MNRLIVLAVLFFSTILYSQVVSNEDKGRWTFGGDLGIGGGSNGGFSIVVSPEVGYLFPNGFEVGGKIGYNYYKNNFQNSSFINVGPYINYSILPSLFVRAQYQYLFGSTSLKGNRTFPDGTDKNNFSESALWLGGGYQNRISDNVYYRIGAMYNVLYDSENSLYGTGFLPFAGVSVGF